MDYLPKQDVLGTALDRLTYQFAKNRGESILFGPAIQEPEISFLEAAWLFAGTDGRPEYAKQIFECNREELMDVVMELFKRTQTLLQDRAVLQKKNEELSLELNKLIDGPLQAPKLEQKDLISLLGG